MPTDFDIREAYRRIKHKLPELELLDNEFELAFIDYKAKDEKFLLRAVRRKVNEKIIFYCRIIEGVLYPNQANIISMVEGNSFNEDEKKKIHEFYRKLMSYERWSLTLDVCPDDKKDAEFINNVFNSWKEFNKEMGWITEKMKLSWSLLEEKEEKGYWG